MSLWLCASCHQLQGPSGGACSICGGDLERAELGHIVAGAVDITPLCDRCGKRKGEHSGIELFCPFLSTYRAAATTLTTNTLASIAPNGSAA